MIIYMYIMYTIQDVVKKFLGTYMQALKVHSNHAAIVLLGKFNNFSKSGKETLTNCRHSGTPWIFSSLATLDGWLPTNSCFL